MSKSKLRITERLLSWRDVRNRVSLSRATVFALRRNKRFPQPVRVSPGRVAWKESDIARWIAERESCARTQISGRSAAK